MEQQGIGTLENCNMFQVNEFPWLPPQSPRYVTFKIHRKSGEAAGCLVPQLVLPKLEPKY